jgi:hypothetical protein
MNKLDSIGFKNKILRFKAAREFRIDVLIKKFQDIHMRIENRGTLLKIKMVMNPMGILV